MKIPPYGKSLKNLLNSGQLPSNSVYLYIGDKAWETGKNSIISRPNRTLLLPPKASPTDYTWPVNGCDILIIETSISPKKYIDDIVYILFSFGARKAIVIHWDFSITFYKKDF